MSLMSACASLSASVLAAIDKADAGRRERSHRRDRKFWRSIEDRRYALSKLGFLSASDIDDLSLSGRQTMVRRLNNALRNEHRRSQSNHRLHWTYEPSRHAALLFAFRSEEAAVRAIVSKASTYLEDAA